MKTTESECIKSLCKKLSGPVKKSRHSVVHKALPKNQQAELYKGVAGRLAPCFRYPDRLILELMRYVNENEQSFPHIRTRFMGRLWELF
jgi:hypothetical protein